MKTLAEILSVTADEGQDSFVGQSFAYGVVGVYGGHFLGQSLAAAFETVPPDKVASSMHAVFLRAGSPDEPIRYRVERLREGRGFDTRVVTATQGSAPVFHMTASFKIPEPSHDEHQKPMPEAPTPDSVKAAREARGGEQPRFPMTVGGGVDMELISDHFIPAEFAPGREPTLQAWMRVIDEGLDDRMSQCMLAYLADGTLMFNSALPYGVPFRTHRLTSLDQAIWFHRPCDVSDWMFYDQRSTVVTDGRGMNEGELFDTSGRQILTTAQESMLRRMDG